jgi:hypothetical protein
MAKDSLIKDVTDITYCNDYYKYKAVLEFENDSDALLYIVKHNLNKNMYGCYIHQIEGLKYFMVTNSI